MKESNIGNHSQSLTILLGGLMYLNFFSLSEKPFDITPDTRFLYASPQHEEVIETLLYGIRERRGFMTLTGEVGTGKTTSVRALLNRLGPDVDTALIVNPILSTIELLKTINKDFGIAVPSEDSAQSQIEALNQFLIGGAEAGRNAVVIVDEAQDLSHQALEMMRLLSNLETETHKLLQLVLVGQPEFEERLRRHDLRQLRQRIQIRYCLGPLNLEETEKYVLFRLNAAEPGCCVEFEHSAMKKIHERSGGIPRLINRLCELALMAAYTEETHVITKRIVGIASHEMEETRSWSPPFWRRRMRRSGEHVSSS